MFSERQADAILNMRLYKLIGLELDALLKEHEETVANIYKYEDILEQRTSMTQVIRRELLSYRKEFAVPRKTKIINEEQAEFVKPREEETDVVFCRFPDGPLRIRQNN